MLEEVIEYWKRYEACVDLFHVWLGDAEQVLKKPPEERGVRVSYDHHIFLKPCRPLHQVLPRCLHSP